MTELRYSPVPLDEVMAARDRTRNIVVRTPLVRLNVQDTAAEVYLKLELLQPVNSFKLRGAANAILKAGPERLKEGIWTASAGNMAQGVAYAARAIGVPATVIVPVTAPKTKIAAVERFGGKVITIPVDEWVNIFRTREYAGMSGVFVHPYSDPDVLAGNSVIGWEILQDLPDADAVLIPWGGGGICCGIASAVKAINPKTRIYAIEVSTGAPLAPSMAAGRLVEVPFTPNFVDGIGNPFVNGEMFELARQLVDDVIVMDPEPVARAVKTLVERNRVVAEGAGAIATAAALSGKAGTGKIVSLVSGGNIDLDVLVTCLQDGVPA